MSYSGHRYYVLFLDDYSKYLWTFPIAKKSQVFSIFATLKAHIRTQFERDIKNIQCDNGREFDNNILWKFCESNGIIFRFHVHILHHKIGSLEKN